MKKALFSKILSLVLIVALLLGFALPGSATPGDLSWRKSDRNPATDLSGRRTEAAEQPSYQPTDIVRVSIVLEQRPTIQAGFSASRLAKNEEAMAYSRKLLAAQEELAQTISRTVLGGEKLDVVWNLTLAGNIISANVAYGKLDAIRAVEGVKRVFVERTYEPQRAEKEETLPQMITSSAMIGSNLVWANGYTGAGSRIAVIDTGTDTDHQSFDNGAFLYALEQNAMAANMTKEAYIKSLNLLGIDEIASVLEKLNVYRRNPNLTAEDLFLNEKLAFGYNYVDNSLYITHDRDNQGEHGSHVTGIAAANRYIPGSAGYLNTVENYMVTGVAPDAQIITMKVFGITGSTTDADYMAAIEDAILLGCDAVNLSLGTSSAGEPYDDEYASLLEYLEQTDIVVVGSAGNAGQWAENTFPGHPYADDAVFDTVGAPAGYKSWLAVASVENSGSVGLGFIVGDRNIVYNQSSYSNLPMATLDRSTDGSGTEYDYIFIDGFGTAADYTGLDLTGKVVFVSRGDTTFSDKANLAASLGAAAIVVYNNQPGINNMDLTNYNYTAPCVSIYRADGMAIRALSAEQTTEAGLKYFTGKMTVTGRMLVSKGNSEYYTMSDFSSWGVPGNLSLKPEITAPGGKIYSVYGSTPQGGGSDQYEIMSGTSMASPQIAGMVALVAQYLRQNDLCKKTGLTPRQLATSLLMSTAEPLFEEISGGNYYSLLAQGAGLGRVDLATAAESYILVDGQTDGKVKVELGDDPGRAGVYTFTFSINNMNGKEITYALSADLFRQGVTEHSDYPGLYLLDSATTGLAGETTFAVTGGETLRLASLLNYDFNEDGKTDSQDVDLLLDYVLGKISGLKGDGDINGDGSVNTYDAHLLLKLIEGSTCVKVPASGSVSVTVTMTLSKSTKDYLDTYTPNGTYIEAFVYAAAVADAEDAVGTTHSIPVLGFYGNWSDSSMFDRGTRAEMVSNASDVPPYLYNVIGNGNFLSIRYGDEDGEYYFGGNPYTSDDTYLQERNALNNTDGDTIANQYFTLIRNAPNAKILITDAKTGEIYFEKPIRDAYAPFFSDTYGAWQNTQNVVTLGWAGTDADGNALPEGSSVWITMVAAPSYYTRYTQTTGDNGETITVKTVDWEALGEGAYMSTRVTIDNTAPAVSGIVLDLVKGDTLRVSAQDNEYIASVSLLNGSGSSTLVAVSPNQTERGAAVDVELDLTGVTGKSFLVAVYDYAGNVSTYEVELGEREAYRPYFTVCDYPHQMYVGIEKDGLSAVELAKTNRATIQAAEYVDGYVFEISEGKNLYVANDNDLGDFRFIATLDPEKRYEITNTLDLAYSYKDGKLYILFYAEANGQNTPYFGTVDMYTGELDVLAEMPVDVNSMAVDEQGNFYSVGYRNPTLYTYTVESVTAEEPAVSVVGSTGYWSTGNLNSLAWDHNTQKLYWAYPNILFEVNHNTGECTQIGGYFMFSMTGLYIRPASGSSRFEPTDEVLRVTLDHYEARTLVGQSIRLNAQVWPWNVTDSSVTWSSSDPSVATVNEKGVIKGVSAGTVTITAAAVLDPTKTASCTVEVITLDKTLNGIVWDEEGGVWWSEFESSKLPAFKKLTQQPSDVELCSTAVAPNGTIYAASANVSGNTLRSTLYTVDPNTFAATEIGPSTNGYSDIAYAPHLKGGSIIATYGGYVLFVDPTTGDYSQASGDVFHMWQYNLLGIAYAGSDRYTEWGYDTTIDWYFLIDAKGFVYLMGWLEDGGSLYYLEHPATDDGVFTRIDVETDAVYCCSLYYDGSFLYYSCYDNNTDLSTLYAIDTVGTRAAYRLGDFGKGIWPVGGLMELTGVTTDSMLNGLELTAAPKPVSESPAPKAKVETSAAVPAAQDAPDFRLLSRGTAVEGKRQIVVEITPFGDSTNGRMSVGYNPEELVLVSATGLTEGFSVKQSEGAVELAYASAHNILADEVIAVLVFDVTDQVKDTVTVDVGQSEINNETGGIGTTIEIEVPAVEVCPSERFVDIYENEWYHEAVDYVVKNGLMIGMDETHFEPNSNMTRAQLVQVLYRMAGSPETEAQLTFTDVAKGQWYYDAVAWASANGITMGIDETHFAPNDPVTREQMVTFFARFAKSNGIDTSYQGNLSDFTDAGKVSDYAVDAMTWTYEIGLINGMENHRLNPGWTAQRSQAATVLMRYCLLFID